MKLYLKRKNKAIAAAEYDLEDGSFTVLKESTVSTTIAHCILKEGQQ